MESLQIKNTFKHQRPRIIHELKIHFDFADQVRTGSKLFELRINDRDYRVGDLIRFTVLDYYTVHMIEFEKTFYVITSVIEYRAALKDGYVALGIRKFDVGSK